MGTNCQESLSESATAHTPRNHYLLLTPQPPVAFQDYVRLLLMEREQQRKVESELIFMHRLSIGITHTWYSLGIELITVNALLSFLCLRGYGWIIACYSFVPVIYRFCTRVIVNERVSKFSWKNSPNWQILFYRSRSVVIIRPKFSKKLDQSYFDFDLK